jgi:DNA-directed RNA polymerase subunit M/transcription elongation factor TFIIS
MAKVKVKKRVKAVKKQVEEKSATGKKKVEAYCVKCKEKRFMKNPKQTEMKNGRPAVRGVCPECGTGMYKIGSM